MNAKFKAFSKARVELVHFLFLYPDKIQTVCHGLIYRLPTLASMMQL
jgi:hypothetical protein